jgi:hypothetical protein
VPVRVILTLLYSQFCITLTLLYRHLCIMLTLRLGALRFDPPHFLSVVCLDLPHLFRVLGRDAPFLFRVIVHKTVHGNGEVSCAFSRHFAGCPGLNTEVAGTKHEGTSFQTRTSRAVVNRIFRGSPLDCRVAVLQQWDYKMSDRTDHSECTTLFGSERKVEELLSSHGIQYCPCRKISDVLKGVELKINSQGFSELWDRAGLFSGKTKTIYLADEGWDGGEPFKFPAEYKEYIRGHETGHAVDYCLGHPSLSDEFIDAWRRDIANNKWPQDVKEKICGRLLEETTGPKELWADFFAFVMSGFTGAVGTAYFPSALEIFNRQIHALELGPIRPPEYTKAMFPERDQKESPRL